MPLSAMGDDGAPTMRGVQLRGCLRTIGRQDAPPATTVEPTQRRPTAA